MARHILNHLATDLEGAFKLTETTNSAYQGRRGVLD